MGDFRTVYCCMGREMAEICCICSQANVGLSSFKTKWPKFLYRSTLYICAHGFNNNLGIQYNKMLNFAIFWPFFVKNRTFLAPVPPFHNQMTWNLVKGCSWYLSKWPMYNFWHKPLQNDIFWDFVVIFKWPERSMTSRSLTLHLQSARVHVYTRPIWQPFV